MPKTLVNQGRYVMATNPTCGTNGLGTCVGAAIYVGMPAGEWFIAHIDCEALVKTRQDPMWGRVAAYVTNQLNRLLGPCGSPNVHIIGGLGDFSAQAIRDGIIAWVNGTVDIQYNDWDGFEIIKGNQFQRLGHDKNNSDGDGSFSVPKNP